jgi:hypothetical protein
VTCGKEVPSLIDVHGSAVSMRSLEFGCSAMKNGTSPCEICWATGLRRAKCYRDLRRQLSKTRSPHQKIQPAVVGWVADLSRAC